MADTAIMDRTLQAMLDRNEAEPPPHRLPAKIEAKPESPRRVAQIGIVLPFWPSDKRGTPNTFLRSSLFAAIQGKHRRQLKQEVLGSLKDTVITFTGEQLNQSDLDVWEALVNLAREKALGEPVCFAAHGLLKSLGLHTGKADYAWLESVIVRLTSAQVTVLHKRHKYSGTLIHEWFKDEEKYRYKIVMNEKLINLYGPAQWTEIDWSQREKLRRHPLAQALHSFYSSHEEPYAYKLETLKVITGSRNLHNGSFKRQMKKALDLLVSIEFLETHSFEGELVVVARLSAN